MISIPFSIKFSARDMFSKMNGNVKATINSTAAIILFLVFIVLLGKNVGESFSNLFSHREKLSNLNHLQYLYVEDYLKNRIEDTNKKVEELKSTGAEVYILDSEAAIYNIIKDEYYKDYDMFNRGNFGENGEEKIMNNIKESHNTYYLVRNPEIALNWQTPKSIVEEIRTYQLKGRVGLFDIYYKE